MKFPLMKQLVELGWNRVFSRYVRDDAHENESAFTQDVETSSLGDGDT